jgi:predicted O-methyltransferase YrrM
LSKILIDQLFPDAPFFHGNTQGIQGNAFLRHPAMSASVFAHRQAAHRLQILEIGSYAGFSALTWAQSLEEFCPQGGDVLCVDPWLGYFDGDDAQKEQHKNLWQTMADDRSMEEIYNLFQHNISFGASKKVSVTHFRAPAEAAVRYLRDEFFDLVYVDGRHAYQHVIADLRMAKRLVRQGGFLCGDDLEVQIRDVDAEFAQAHRDDHVCVDPITKQAYHVGVALAVQEFFGEVSNFSGYYAMRRTGDGFEKVDLSQCATVIPKHFPPVWQEALKQAIAKTSRPAA